MVVEKDNELIMKNILKLEEAAQLIFTVYLNTFLPYAWWWYWVWILAPDLSMLGYLINTKAGAAAYNFVHHKELLWFAI